MHVHLGPSDSSEAYYPTLSGAEYIQHADAAGVQRAYAFPPYRHGGYREANEALRAWAKTTQGKVGCFARLGGPHVLYAQWPPHLWQIRRRLRRSSRAGDLPSSLDGFDGIKLLPHVDGVPLKTQMRDIHDRELPVLVHGGRYVSPAWIAKNILPRTAGTLIIAHLGGFPHEGALLDEGIAVAQQHPRIYLDTSGIWDVSFLQRAAARVPDKLLFGSDAPLTTPSVAWQHVASAIQDEEILRLLGHETPVRLGFLRP